MGFDWKAFGAAFLDKQTEAIRKRRTDAEEYEEEQEELAKENKKLLRNRTLLANDAAQMARKAMDLGATKDQVMAAMGSGALGIKTFYEKLLAAANQKGMQTLGSSDIEAIIDMPEVFEVNEKYIDLTLDEMAKIQYGAMVDPTIKQEKVKTSDSLLASMFGVDAMNQAKKSLQDPVFAGGMSVADINELATQADYDSLFPNLGVNFFDKEFYGPEAASSFIKDITEIELDVVSDSKAKKYMEDAGTIHQQKMEENSELYDKKYAEQAKEEGLTILDVQEAAKNELIKMRAEALIESTVGKYGQTGLFDHEGSVDVIKRIMGDEFVDTELELTKSFNRQDDREKNIQATQEGEELFAAKERIREADKQVETKEENPMDLQEPQAPETETSNTEAEKEALLAKTFPKRPSSLSAKRVGWDRDYKGKVDPKSGKVIIAPPRPTDGGEKTKELPIRTGNILNAPTGKMKKVTEAEYWDATYGETHDPTSGLPFGYEALLED